MFGIISFSILCVKSSITFTSSPMNGGMIPKILKSPSKNSARHVKPRIILIIVASLLCFLIDASSMADRKSVV